MNKDWNYKLVDKIFDDMNNRQKSSIDELFVLSEMFKEVDKSKEDGIDKVFGLLKDHLDLQNVFLITNKLNECSTFYDWKTQHVKRLFVTRIVDDYFNGALGCESIGCVESLHHVHDMAVHDFLVVYSIHSWMAIKINTIGLLVLSSDYARDWSKKERRILYGLGLMLSTTQYDVKDKHMTISLIK